MTMGEVGVWNGLKKDDVIYEQPQTPIVSYYKEGFGGSKVFLTPLDVRNHQLRRGGTGIMEGNKTFPTAILNL